MLNGKLIKPFSLVPPDSHLPVFNKAEVNSQLSSKFKAFCKQTDQKGADGKKASGDSNNENQHPRSNIQRPSTSSNDVPIPIEDRAYKFRNNSYARRHDFGPKVVEESTSDKEDDSINEAKPRKRNFDHNLDKLHSHPLYK